MFNISVNSKDTKKVRPHFGELIIPQIFFGALNVIYQ